MSDIKVGDCAVLIHGYSPKYSVSKIDTNTQMVTCVWFDATKTRKTITELLPLNVLKKYEEPEPIDLSALRR